MLLLEILRSYLQLPYSQATYLYKITLVRGQICSFPMASEEHCFEWPDGMRDNLGFKEFPLKIWF